MTRGGRGRGREEFGGVPRGRTSAEEAARILRGLKKRVDRLEEERSPGKVLNIILSATDGLVATDSASLTEGPDLQATDGATAGDTVTLSEAAAASGTFDVDSFDFTEFQ